MKTKIEEEYQTKSVQEAIELVDEKLKDGYDMVMCSKIKDYFANPPRLKCYEITCNKKVEQPAPDFIGTT